MCSKRWNVKKPWQHYVYVDQCFSTGVPWATSKCAANLFVFTFLGEKKSFGLQKGVLLGLFQKFLDISVPPNFSNVKCAVS